MIYHFSHFVYLIIIYESISWAYSFDIQINFLKNKTSPIKACLQKNSSSIGLVYIVEANGKLQK